jgi:NADH:ubiquinone oxidoreductase subunit 6 (subunit J)|tara:strand:- start:660 stop:1259 length:600 start_codon:yes stop_codon:yes gene_type:complete
VTEQTLFWIFAILAGGGAIGVVILQDIVRMAFSLIISLGSTAGLFFLLGADFVAATQLLVYVGGTLVLLIFGVMLTASGPFQRIKMSAGETFLGAAVGLLFFSVIAFTVIDVNWEATNARQVATTPGDETGNTSRAIGLRLVGISADTNIGMDTKRNSRAGYLLPFEIVSVHLLVVLVGAAYLARAKRQESSQSSQENV